MRRLLQLLRPHRAAVALIVALSLAAAVTALLQPLVLREVLAAVTDDRPVGALVGLLLAVLLVSTVLSGAQRYMLQRTAEGVVLTTRARLVDRLLRLPIAELETRRLGDLISRVGADTSVVRTVVTSGLVDLLSGLVIAVGSLVLMARIDAVLLLVTLLSVSLAVVSVVVVSRRIRRLSERAQAAVGEMTAAVERALGATRTIRAARAESREIEATVASARSAYEAGLRVARLEATVAPLAGVAVQTAFLSVLGIGGARVASGAIEVADIVAFVLYLFLFVQPVGQGLNAWTEIQAGLGALTRIDEIQAIPPESADEPAGPAPDPVPGEPMLRFDDVRFAYADGTPVLHGVDLVVRRGERVALVGPSGAGKSTVLALVERLYDPTGGRILLDGVDVAALPRDAVRRRLAYVEQDAPALAGSLRENLLLAAPDATDDDLLAALGSVNLLGLTERTPLGLGAQVGDEGVLLSGGERQRLAIARALLAEPDLLLLDEPTASLDARNEAALAAVVRTAAERTSVLVVAHRLSTVVDADRIVVLDGGRVAGTGTHADLLDSTPLYRELAATQLLV